MFFQLCDAGGSGTRRRKRAAPKSQNITPPRVEFGRWLYFNFLVYLLSFKLCFFFTTKCVLKCGVVYVCTSVMCVYVMCNHILALMMYLCNWPWFSVTPTKFQILKISSIDRPSTIYHPPTSQHPATHTLLPGSPHPPRPSASLLTTPQPSINPHHHHPTALL